MQDITTYIKSYGHLDFKAMAFNEVDALILSQLSYLNLELLHKHEEPFYIRDMDHHKTIEAISRITYEPKLDEDMLSNLATSPRFKDLQIIDIFHNPDYSRYGQFFAFSIKLFDHAYAIVYRGTDASFKGWSETLRLTADATVLAQNSARKYLERMANELSGNFYVMGHSKGGNLAVYAASTVSQEKQDRINWIYNFDGPGFHKGFFKFAKTNALVEKTSNYIPRQSVVGLMFEQIGHFIYVDATGFLLEQHQPYKWLVKGTHFKRLVEPDNSAKYINRAFNKWMEKFSEDQRNEAFYQLMDVISSSGAKDFNDILNNKMDMFGKIRHSYSHKSEEELAPIKSAISEFWQLLKEEVKAGIFNNLSE